MIAPFPIRGTPEWDAREHEREQAGCECLSFGPIPDAADEPTDDHGDEHVPGYSVEHVMAALWASRDA